ncbi:xanthine dehydrogenase family protein molybdopterin-binding subunit [Kibdelosporangium persicum]|uniref:Aldehyde oxidase and xanthine dehydrogenase molybdopterin binding n=1 Tax=Kibdelosporangium persicum TaxID=2698649 RepID=A0ABX2F1Q0_9PSEU|nr:xanthine dehydrogenase family protein molybdopterin-binding subunit [Kibdelosporangium persicum]NRN65256.1 Aldehyde oxidase and xanthine dehydrogenase molybdopterin binding [Kibdelosporangium persicum]
MSIGTPITRIEAPSKVNGQAVYTADVQLPGMVHAVMVGSTIAAGRLRAIDTRAAESAPGVLAVLTHRNVPRWHGTPDDLHYVEPRFPLADTEIHYHDQCVAVVVATTREQAAYAAGLVAVEYEARPVVASLDAALPTAHEPVWRFEPLFPSVVEVGGPKEAFAGSAAKVDAEYRTPYHSHAPIEPNATVAQWERGRLNIHKTSQDVHGDRRIIAGALGVPADHVRVWSTLVGGAFGNKTTVWPHTLLAAVASRQVGPPVRLVTTRKQVFTGHGHQPPIIQHLRVGADADGTLRAIIHETTNGTPILFDDPEPTISPSASMYAVPALGAYVRVADMHMPAPALLRTPGDGPGMFAVGSAMDELSYALNLDPLELRRRNHLAHHPLKRKPWSGKQLLDCYALGAERFGWDRRAPRPRAMRDGDDWVGFGMSSAQRLEPHTAATATVAILDDGTAEVRTSIAEIGTGNLTTLVQIAADGTGVPVRRFGIVSGDTDLPEAAPTHGSRSTGSTGTAVHLAAQNARLAATRLAVADPRSPLHGLPTDRVGAADGRLFAVDAPERGESYQDLLRRNHVKAVTEEGHHDPNAKNQQFAFATFGAHFTEVRINRNVPRVRVTRHVAVFAIGRVLNPKTARNQAQGGIVFAAGQTLSEQLTQDPATGLFVTPAFTDYHVPVHADVGEIDVSFVEEPDYNAHPHGAKGLGEVVCVGVHAAIANAVYHATGIRVRELPITPDKLARLVRESG